MPDWSRQDNLTSIFELFTDEELIEVYNAYDVWIAECGLPLKETAVEKELRHALEVRGIKKEWWWDG